MRACLLGLLICLVFSGCASVHWADSSDSDCKTVDSTIDAGALFGLIGMAVDGDDKEEYEGWGRGHDCDCKCRCCD